MRTAVRRDPGADKRGQRIQRGPAAAGIRDMGLKAVAQAASAPTVAGVPQGTWCIPQFHADVPAAFTNDSDRQATLAALSLHLHEKEGMPIANDEPFSTVEHTMQQQIADYIVRAGREAGCLPDEPVGAEVVLKFGIDENGSAIARYAFEHNSGGLPLVHLKPHWDRLQAIQTGLGDVLLEAIDRSAAFPPIFLFDYQRVRSDAANWLFHGCDTDRDFYDAWSEGWDEQVSFEDFCSQQPHRPSTLDQAYGYWAQRYKQRGNYAHVPPALRALRQWKQWHTSASANPGLREQAQTVGMAIRIIERSNALTRAFKRARQRADSERTNVLSYVEGIEGDLLGGLAYVVWDDHEGIADTVEHIEQYQQESECTTFAYAREFLYENKATWPVFANDLKARIHEIAETVALIQRLESIEALANAGAETTNNQ